MLAALPVGLRTAAAQLLDLGDYEIPMPGHSIARVPAGRAFVWLASGRLDPDEVSTYLRAHRLVRPGLAEAGHIINRKDSTMPSTTVRFVAVVGANLHSPGHPCDTDGCRAAAAEFTVSCADQSGALVAGEVIYVCAEHLPAAVRLACAD